MHIHAHTLAHSVVCVCVAYIAAPCTHATRTRRTRVRTHTHATRTHTPHAHTRHTHACVQAGGILPGFKRCSSAAALPLRVVSHVLPLAEGHCAALSRQLQLVYTGKTRLARNLLQAPARVARCTRVPTRFAPLHAVIGHIPSRRPLRGRQDVSCPGCGPCI